MINNVYGKLKVKSRCEDSICSGSRYQNWECICECGNIIKVRQNNLISGNTKSCGCSRLKSKKLINLIGKRFGSLIVISRAKDHIQSNGRKRTMWFCKCDCGKEITILGDNLKLGYTLSCGCYRTKRIKEICITHGLSKTKEYGRICDKKRRSTPKGKVRNSVNRRIHKLLRCGKGGKSWKSLMNYSYEELISHLEKQFQPGMTWENYGKWHIDHKIPIDAFNFSSVDDIDFKRCWSLNNIQPLWAKDNMIKSNKINGEFQPCLNLKF